MKPESDILRTAERRRIEIALAMVTLAFVAAVAAVGFFVAQEYAIASSTHVPLRARSEAAKRVSQLRPFSGTAEVTSAILEGRLLFSHEATWDQAQELLYETYLRHIGNKPLRAELSVVNKAVMLRDAGKAHKQHGHEGPNGELRPQDIER